MAFIAGGYTATWNSVDIGNIRDGFEFQFTPAGHEIVAQNYGDSEQDGVYRGGNCFVSFIISEYNATGVAAMMWPFGTLGVVGTVGALMTSLAQGLVLTAVSGTNATPTTWTFSKTIVALNNPIQFPLAPKHREIPIRLRAYPYVSSVAKWFSTA